MRTLLLAAAVALLWATPAQAFGKQTGTRTMSDGTQIAYDLYEPSGPVPTNGWPAVVVLHGLGGSKESVAPVAAVFAAQGYAALAYSARGHGSSTGDVELAGAKEVADERAMLSYLAGLPDVSNTNVGAWGISYGGGEIWNGLAAGIPFKAAEILESWTDLYSALWPQDVAKSGIVLGLAKSVDARSPLIAANEADAVRSTAPAKIRALAAPRSVAPRLSSITTPTYLFQGRVDYAFDVTQAATGYSRIRGPKHLYVGQFGHPPSTFPGPDVAYVTAQGLAWFDHYLRGVPNGIDRSPPVTVAAASGRKRASYPGLPRTKVVGAGFRGTGMRRVGPPFGQALETFGVSLLKVQVRRVSHYPRLVATVLAGNRVVTHGAIVPKPGLQTIRLANYVQYLPKGTRLTVVFGPSSSLPDLAYLGFGDQGAISLGPAFLSLQVLTKPVSGASPALAHDARAAYRSPRLVASGVPGGPVRLGVSVANTDDPTARIAIYVPAAYRIEAPPPGTKLGDVTATAAAADLGGVVLPVGGELDAIDPNRLTPGQRAGVTQCLGGESATQTWLLHLNAGTTTLDVPLLVVPATAAESQAGYQAKIVGCLPPPDVPAGTPGRATFGAKLLSATFAVSAITEPTASGDYRWSALLTPYIPAKGVAGPAATVETQSLRHVPTALRLTYTKQRRRGGEVVRTVVRYATSVTENGTRISGVPVTARAGGKRVGGARGTFTFTGGGVTLTAAATLHHAASVPTGAPPRPQDLYYGDVGAGSCTATPAFGGAPCIQATAAAVTVRASVRIRGFGR